MLQNISYILDDIGPTCKIRSFSDQESAIGHEQEQCWLQEWEVFDSSELCHVLRVKEKWLFDEMEELELKWENSKLNFFHLVSMYLY